MSEDAARMGVVEYKYWCSFPNMTIPFLSSDSAGKRPTYYIHHVQLYRLIIPSNFKMAKVR